MLASAAPTLHPWVPLPLMLGHACSLSSRSRSCSQRGRLLTTPATPACTARCRVTSSSTTHTSTGIPIREPVAPRFGWSNFDETLHPLHRTPRAAASAAAEVRLAYGRPSASLGASRSRTTWCRAIDTPIAACTRRWMAPCAAESTMSANLCSMPDLRIASTMRCNCLVHSACPGSLSSREMSSMLLGYARARRSSSESVSGSSVLLDIFRMRCSSSPDVCALIGSGSRRLARRLGGCPM
mmetsp:Transcript_30393/g.92832  ORF Transcript_30393/g.92832 Transcript_30393/m.92832 type:complete len:240 (-) Transcript_30393:641-1360(-)